MHNSEFSNVELVTIAVALLNGDKAYVDREDVALKVNDIAPGRFNWLKHPDRIDLEAVNVALRDARKTRYGELVIGNSKKGWMLTPSGLKWIKTVDLNAAYHDPSVAHRKTSIRANLETERIRLLNTKAYDLFVEGNARAITVQDFYEFARVNEYFQTKARQRRYAIVANAVIDNDTLSRLWELLRTKFSKEMK